MPKLKSILSLFLGVAVIIAQAGSALAAPSWQADGPITGIVQGAVVESNSASDIQTVLVTLLVHGETQSIHVSVQTAADLGLISLDENGIAVVDESVWGSDLTIPSADILSNESVKNEKQHPVGSKIAEFFSGFVDVDYELVMSSRSNRFGFGVITQALWMTDNLGGDATLFETILDAKKSNDYTSVALPETAIPQNWGQFKKTILQEADDNTPGDVISGDTGKPDDNGNGNPPATPPGQNKDKDNNGNGNPPATPPGQEDKNKDNNGNSGNPPGQNKDKNQDNNGNGKTK